MTLWTAPDDTHPLFAAMRDRHGVTLARQPDGDLGARMHAAVVAANGPVLVVGTDCPAMISGPPAGGGRRRCATVTRW